MVDDGASGGSGREAAKVRRGGLTERKRESEKDKANQPAKQAGGDSGRAAAAAAVTTTTTMVGNGSGGCCERTDATPE